MRIIGLTEGIAMGKSFVSNLFKANEFLVVDVDVVARDVLKKGNGGWRKVVAAPSKHQLLNRLLASYISYGILWEVFKLWIKGYKIIILDVPLLFEAKMDRWTDPTIVIWIDPETQLEHLMARGLKWIFRGLK